MAKSKRLAATLMQSKQPVATLALAAVLAFALALALSMSAGSLVGSVDAYAAGGDGSGGGTGGGSLQPFAFESSTPASGAKDIPSDTKFVLQFNKNVVNIAVKENNQKAVTLWAGAQQVEVEIQMTDDQVEREDRELITLVPKEPLAEATEYILRIDETLTAKNGSSLEKPIELRFYTAGYEFPAGHEPATEDGSAAGPGHGPEPISGEVPTARDGLSPLGDGGSQDYFLIGAAAVLVIGLAGVGVALWREKKRKDAPGGSVPDGGGTSGSETAGSVSGDSTVPVDAALGIAPDGDETAPPRAGE